MKCFKMILTLLISTNAVALKYEFPPDGTEVKFSCRVVGPDKKEKSKYTGTITYQKLASKLSGVNDEDILQLSVKTSLNEKLSFFRAPWQIPFDTSYMTVSQRGQFKDLPIGDNKPSADWKLKDKKLVRVTRVPPHEKRDVKLLIQSEDARIFVHEAELNSAGYETVQTSKGEKRIRTFTTISKGFDSNRNVTQRWEVVYSDVLKVPLRTRRISEDGTEIICENTIAEVDIHEPKEKKDKKIKKKAAAVKKDAKVESEDEKK